ncbi:helix-turn-helix domain-containing protein [Fuscovulum blasticum]|uniref:helix-turn-helix domain-containing protein n=1 Tax=Fuscovulum blasticum TaxID=1075 RepID=UPI000F4D5B2F|nr:helix-turn-helix transcriptional regulator [Fuscovulum blasticum]
MNSVADRVTENRNRLREILTGRIGAYSDFVKKLQSDDSFDRKLFRQFRSSTMSQSDWADSVGVSQATIGNWERGITYPGRKYRRLLLVAGQRILNQEIERINNVSKAIGITVPIDVISTKSQLDSSILKASLTDFAFDPESNRIIAVPFEKDQSDTAIEQIVQDRRNLLASLSEQSALIMDGISRGANIETDRFIEHLKKYQAECNKDAPNPRLLHRLGATIAGRTSDDEFRAAINGWDDQAIDGFNADHIELMRLYFREALARAQEVESSAIDESNSSVDPAASFGKAADLIASAVDKEGNPVFSPDIPTLLRDISREVRDFGEAEAFTYDDRRKAVIRRRRLEAIKSGSIYMGRFLFFTSLFVVVSPEALGAASSVASILGLMDQIAPGTIRSLYDSFRSVFPILPKLETKKKDQP